MIPAILDTNEPIALTGFMARYPEHLVAWQKMSLQDLHCIFDALTGAIESWKLVVDDSET
jgi:hypothetical protein